MIYAGDNVLPWDCPEAIRLREETTRSAVSVLFLFVPKDVRVSTLRTHLARFSLWNLAGGDDHDRIERAMYGAEDVVMSWHGIPVEASR